MYENQVYLPDVFHLRYSAILSPALLLCFQSVVKWLL